MHSIMPLTIVDIGALGGVHPKWERVPYRAVLFEPNPDARFAFRDNWLVVPEALSNEAGEHELYVAKKRSNSSLYRPNYELLYRYANPGRYETVQTVRIQTSTLDQELRRHEVEDIDHIKVDVQGHELRVLEGASESLKKAVSVEVEVQFAPIYEQVPLFGEVDAFLRNAGFELAALPHMEWWEGGGEQRLIWGDALYFKNPAALPNHKRERLAAIEKILLPPKSRFVRFMSNIAFYSRKGRLKTFANIAPKRLLARAGLMHPALGIKLDASEKAAALYQAKTAEIKTLVETGTNFGETIEKIGGYFEKVYSVEFNEMLYQKARERFASKQNVEIFHGDSAVELQNILTRVQGPALFWLDAHDSGTITADNSPIIGELEAIFAHEAGSHHVVLIDDARLFSLSTLAQMRHLAQGAGYIMDIQNGLIRMVEKRRK